MVTILDALKTDGLRANEMLESLANDINNRSISYILSVTLKRDDLLVSEKMFIAYALGASVGTSAAKVELKKEK